MSDGRGVMVDTGTHGSSWYSQARQKPGICGLGIATPQKSAKMMMMGGFKSIALELRPSVPKLPRISQSQES
jgi:hypothetical protein